MLGLGLGLDKRVRKFKPKNLLVYTPSTWAEWALSGPVGDATGLEFTADSTNYKTARLNTNFKISTKYGFLYNVVSSGITSNLTLITLEAFGAGTLPKAVGNQKFTAITPSTITSNKFGVTISNTEPAGNKIKIKDIRVFELPTGSIIEADFTNLTSDQLNTKYLF